MEGVFSDEAGSLVPGVEFHARVDVGSCVWVEDTDVFYIGVGIYLSGVSLWNSWTEGLNVLPSRVVEEAGHFSLSSSSSNLLFYPLFFGQSIDGSAIPCWFVGIFCFGATGFYSRRQ